MNLQNRLAVGYQRACLQNRLAVGYQRACQILEQMESDGIVGPESKTGERKVLMEKYEKFKEKGL